MLKRENTEISQCPVALSAVDRVHTLLWPENGVNKYDESKRVRAKLPGEEVELRGGSKAVLCGLRARI